MVVLGLSFTLYINRNCFRWNPTFKLELLGVRIRVCFKGSQGDVVQEKDLCWQAGLTALLARSLDLFDKANGLWSCLE